MIQVGFREYDVESNDFPIRIAVEADAEPLVIQEVTFFFRLRTNPPQIIEKKVKFQAETPTRKALSLARPSEFTLGDIFFTLVALFPPAQAADKVYTTHLVSSDQQKAKDVIRPDSITPVFANYEMHFR